MEKCARFHIVCAERLVEEDSHNFAGKLNDENLTKCLQTLKHMYEDLALEAVETPCEPEFRAYEILMNLARISLRRFTTRQNKNNSFTQKISILNDLNDWSKPK